MFNTAKCRAAAKSPHCHSEAAQKMQKLGRSGVAFLQLLCRYLRSDRWHTVTITSDCQDRTVRDPSVYCVMILILIWILVPEPGANCRHKMFLKKVLVFLDGMQAAEKEINIGPNLIAVPEYARHVLNISCRINPL